MTQKKLDTLVTQTNDFCFNTTPVFIFSENTKDLIRRVLEAAFEEPEQKSEYLKLLEQIRSTCDCSKRLMSATIASIGFDKYKADAYAITEMIFRIALDVYPSEGTFNNLAYVCRRHKAELNSSNVEIIDLLLDGVRNQDTLFMVNMALHFAQNLGNEEDWLLADRLFCLLLSDDPSFEDAIEWWKDLAEESDDEGLIVLLWMERHGHLELPEKLREPAQNLIEHRKDIPSWVFTKYKKTE